MMQEQDTQSGHSWVRSLRPGSVDDLQPTCLPGTWHHAVEQIGLNGALWAVEKSQDMARLIVDPSILEYRRNAVAEALRPTCEAVVLHALLSLDQKVPASSDISPETSYQLRRVVPQRVPLHDILEKQRVAHRFFSEALLADLREIVPVSEQFEAISDLSRFLVDHISSFSTACSVAYLAEERAWLASKEGARSELVYAILNRDAVPGDHSKKLRYELEDRSHIGLICMSDAQSDLGDSVDLERATKEVLQQIGVQQSLLVSRGRAEVWGWGSPTFRTIPSGIAPGAGVRVAIGAVGTGVDGFRRTHHDAVEASRVALLSTANVHGGPVAIYDELKLAAMLTRELEPAERFVREELGELLHSSAQVLRETLKTYIESNCSPLNTAKKLHVAKNTVLYRIRRVEEILNRRVRDEQMVLWTAIYLSEILDLAACTQPDQTED